MKGAAIYEVSQRFFFEAAHTLERATVDAEGSRRIHGHTYSAEVTVRGVPDTRSGMLVDAGVLRESVQGVRDLLDHRMLDDVPGLGSATLENLCAFIARALPLPGLCAVSVWREASGDRCVLRIASTAGLSATPSAGVDGAAA